MHIIKPNWVIHEDDKGHLQTIYSVHVHPDGTRLATGSIQNVVKIWSTAPILDPASELLGEEKAPRLLCRMEGHDGAVLCVRWTYSGGFLATGSDDSIIMVWTRCPGQSKSFGSKAANIEDWKPFKRLAGHTSDVCGLAWSEDDQYLASVGLDNLVMIWDCTNSAFLPYKRLSLHQGHVNGVAWDPVGQYLATQSDDRTVKIWRTTDWKLEADIKAPFIKSPRSFFRRLSWSPDGAHIVTPNAMNGPVFVSAVIDRREWTSDISLVGHENVVEVAAYNPLIFLKDRNAPLEVMNITAVFAIGARNSISIWLTSNSTPLVVLHDVFDRDILDLSWAADGITLYACSSEGRVAAFVIDELLDIATIGPADAKAKFHERYHFEKPDRRQQSRSHLSPTPFPPRFASPAIEPYRAGGSVPTVDNAKASDTLISQQEMTIMPNGKRRIKPVFLGTNESVMFLNSTSTTNGPALPNHFTDSSQNLHPTKGHQPFVHSAGSSNNTSRLTPAIPRPMVHKFPLPSESSSSNPLSHDLGDILHWDDGGKWGEPVALSNQFSHKVGQDDQKRELQINCQNIQGDIDESTHYSQMILSSNGIGNNPTKREELWKEKYPASKFITSASLSQFHVAVGFNDRSLSVYSLNSGRRIMPMICLDGNCLRLQSRDHFLMAITIKGTIMVWNLSTFKAVGGPKKINELSETRSSISFSGITGEGRVIIKIKGGNLYTYDEDLSSWIILSDPDYPSMTEEMKNVSRLNYSDLKIPVGSPYALDTSVLLGASKPQLFDFFLNYVRSLAAAHRFHFLDEFCHDLWEGSGWILSSLNQHNQISRPDRIELLYQIIQILDETKEFQSISQEYSILLKHS